MKWNNIFVAAALVGIGLFSAQAEAQTVIDGSEQGIEPKILTSMLETISESFRDPSSTQVRNIRLTSQTGGYCGEVNTKNGFGAYAGFTPFRFVAERIINAPADDPGPGRYEPASATILDPSDEINLFKLKSLPLFWMGCVDENGRFIKEPKG